MARRRKSYDHDFVVRAKALLTESATENDGKPRWSYVRRELGGEPSISTLMSWFRSNKQGTDSRLAEAGRRGAAARGQAKAKWDVVPPPKPTEDMTRLEFATWRLQDLAALMKRAAEGNPGAIPGIDKRIEHWRREVEGERSKAAPDLDRLGRLRESLTRAGLIRPDGQLTMASRP